MMTKQHWIKIGYGAGIGVGIMIVTAFFFSQVIFPVFLGRPKNVEVPNVVGSGMLQAKRVLVESKLHVIVKDSVYSEEIAADRIVDQRPSPGEMIKQDGTVYLVVSRGSKHITVPNVIGMDYHQAFFTLRSNGLRTVVADSLYSETYPVNSVLRITPHFGTKVLKESQVQLHLSRGSRPVPDSTDAIDRSWF